MLRVLLSISPILFPSLITSNPLIGVKITPVQKFEFPFVVSLGLQVGGREHFCTGTLITHTHVLTAAHCFQKVGRARNVRVLIGTNDLNEGGKKYRLSNIDSWITYDDWAKKDNRTRLYGWNDIAVATLSRKVEEDISLPVISYAKEDEYYDKEAILTGWGDMKDGVQLNHLQKATVRIMSRMECENNMQDLGYAKSDVQINEICTNTVMLGYGDSGGPLLINGNEIIGVNEAVCPNDQPEHKRAFNLHTSIDFYRQFISDVTNTVL